MADHRTTPFSRLKANEKAIWVDKAREIVYPDLRPAYPDHDARLRQTAMDLYYAEG